MAINSYKDLDTWKKAKELTILIYELTKKFPKEEIFGLTNQMRRASISISNNIAEGTGRQYKRDTLQFLFISNGSINEIESMIDVSLSLGFIDSTSAVLIIDKIEETRNY